MTLVRALAHAAGQLSLRRRRERQRGCDVALDIRGAFSNYHFETVFDVGANIGQSAQRFRRSYSDAQLYCFEPVPDTFEALRAAIGHDRRVLCFQLAMGSSRGYRAMITDGTPDLFRLTPPEKTSDVSTYPEVEVETIDTFCAARDIRRVDYLKIDTEGGDLEVLHGASDMLSRHALGFVEVEAGMNPGNTRHVPLERLKAFLESAGYFVFGLYEQMHEWPTRQMHLRRVNAVFVSSTVIRHSDTGTH